jgi:hypothetical protein
MYWLTVPLGLSRCNLSSSLVRRPRTGWTAQEWFIALSIRKMGFFNISKDVEIPLYAWIPFVAVTWFKVVMVTSYRSQRSARV